MCKHDIHTHCPTQSPGTDGNDPVWSLTARLAHSKRSIDAPAVLARETPQQSSLNGREQLGALASLTWHFLPGHRTQPGHPGPPPLTHLGLSPIPRAMFHLQVMSFWVRTRENTRPNHS